MTETNMSARSLPGESLLDASAYPELYAGMLTKRICAFVLDAIAICVLTAIGWVVLGVLGIFTLGLLWLLYGLVFPVIALAYTAFSLGGPHSATPGMRAMGTQMRQSDGAPMNVLLAAVHAVFFWVSVTVLTPFVLVVALFSSRRRLLHDLVLGTVMINSEPMRRLFAVR